MSYEFGTTTVQEDYSRPAPPRRRRWVGVLATLILMAVFVGGLWWAYSRGLQKGTAAADGGAPLFRADPGTVKVKPEQPGGMPVPNQDKLVYNPGRPDTGVERLLPPPEQPLPRPVAPPPAPVQVQPAAMPAPSANAGQVAVPQMAGVQASGVQAGGVQAAVVPAGTATAPAAVSSPAGSDPAKAIPVPGKLDPKSVADAKKGPQVASLTPGSSTLVPPAAPKSILGVLQSVTGTRVQLGAVKTEEEAKQEWERIRRANSDLLGGASIQISRADLGDKGVFYRIQTSPVGDASKLCDSLKARKIACAVVR